jgi:hypothetical protein
MLGSQGGLTSDPVAAQLTFAVRLHATFVLPQLIWQMPPLQRADVAVHSGCVIHSAKGPSSTILQLHEPADA